MRRLNRYIAASGLPLLLAACSGGSTVVSQAPSTGVQRSVLPSTSPAQAYAMVARQIKACWFNPADPVLTKHVFRAEAGAGGASGTDTNIVIYDRENDGKRGLKAYQIIFQRRGKGTAVNAQNFRINPVLGQKMTADIGYWIQGGNTCEGPAQTAAEPPRGSFSGPPRGVSGQTR